MSDYSPKNVALGLGFALLCIGAFVGYGLLIVLAANAHSMWFLVLMLGPFAVLLIVFLVQDYVEWASDRHGGDDE